MNKLKFAALSSALFMGLLIGAITQAEEAVVENTAAESTPVVSVDAADGVTVDTGNEKVDAVANKVAQCAEKKVAMDACPGSFKGVACRKGLELGRYKGLDCPNI